MTDPITPEKKKEPVFLHNRRCNNKLCKGGDQLVLNEYEFRHQAMVRMHCRACNGKRPYSISLSALDEFIKQEEESIS